VPYYRVHTEVPVAINRWSNQFWPNTKLPLLGKVVSPPMDQSITQLARYQHIMFQYDTNTRVNLGPLMCWIDVMVQSETMVRHGYTGSTDNACTGRIRHYPSVMSKMSYRI
jgi:hypothetical protein